MTNYDLEESELIKLQILLSIIFLFTTIISITLSYNFWLKLNKRQTIYTDEESNKILLFNRTLLFVVSAIFVYINVRDKNVKEKYNFEDKFSGLQISASTFSLIASAIVLYVAINSGSNSTSQENPTI